MKKLLFLLFSLVILTIVFLVIVLVINRDSGRGALQVTSVPKSKVYLDGDYIGDTPLCKCDLPQMLPVGEYSVKLVPVQGSYSPFEQQVKIGSSVLSVIDRTFDNGNSSSGDVITLETISDKSGVELLVVSFPSGSKVILDNNEMGVTPLLLKNITASDHEVKVSKKGYNDKVVKIRTVAGFRLEANIFMGLGQVSPSVSASPSANINLPEVTINETPTGFLRVRSDSSVSSSEIGQVKPQEVYAVIAEKSGWYQIKLKTGLLGWISSQYATKK